MQPSVLRTIGRPALLVLCVLGLGIVRAQTPSQEESRDSASSSSTPQRPNVVADPTPADVEAATARCRDGVWSYEKPGPRTCAAHGGVARWLPGRQQDLIRKL